MKKVITLLLLMIFDINGMMNSHAEYSFAKPLIDDLLKTANTSTVKELLVEDKSMTDIMNIIDDNMVIDKINISEYKQSLAKYETGGKSDSYTIVNRYGHAGKYQFSKSTLKTLKNVKLIDFDVDRKGIKTFLKDSVLQEQALNALIIYNLNYAKNKKLFRFVGKKFHGTRITIEGILASSHLLGSYAVYHFFEHNGSLDDFYIQGKKFRKYDGNGVSILDYMKIFEHV